ncbi:iron chelate uptake ABC transporter family permease subunit [Parafrankia discariae]|uniref:iron chelate uptake ABC transporter family permease subunit n=1 Tax=Parafrankia discariae TaxID=365528 RepID=UPI001E59C51C|nr:iron chelate uptake ABC transporter family permease subunit [Parafrankia discariae]
MELVDAGRRRPGATRLVGTGGTGGIGGIGRDVSLEVGADLGEPPQRARHLGWVGLARQTVSRSSNVLVTGADHRFLLPFAAICGALLVLAADTAGRTLFAPAVIPVGIVVAFLGAPLFINLILTRRRQFL